MRARAGFLAAFTAAHGGLTLALMYLGRALARDRLVTGRAPGEAEQWLATLQGVLTSPVLLLLGRFPATAHWFPGLFSALPIAVNSLLWAAAMTWLLHGRGHKVSHLGS